MRRINIILILLCSYASANESFIPWTGGNLFSVSENVVIKMESEKVIIVLNENTYDVDASFVFKNTGDATTVLMGFPVSCGGVIFDRDLINDFEPVLAIRTWINGKETQFTGHRKSLEYFEPLKGDTEIDETSEIMAFKEQLRDMIKNKKVYRLKENYYYVKTVSFSKNEELRTRVQYTAKYGKMGGGNCFLATYIYGSGKGWKDCIDHAEFIIQQNSNIWMINYPYVKQEHRWKRNGEYTYSLTMENFDPEKSDELSIAVSKRNPPYLNEWGIYEGDMSINDAILSLCSQKQLENFLSYEKNREESERLSLRRNNHIEKIELGHSTTIAKEIYDNVRKHLQYAIEKDFVYDVQESKK